jgi:uncharacterized protein with beta-barrel porin domain
VRVRDGAPSFRKLRSREDPIVKTAIRNQAFGLGRKRRLLQCGTALPLLLASWPVLAQPIVEHSSTDIAVDADSASGTPAAIDLRSTGGSITASVDTVTATATAGQRNNIANLDTAGGAINASFGSITLTGDGELLGVRAVAQGGGIDVHVGEMTLEGAITSGVNAHSVTGGVTVRGDNILLLGERADVANGFFPEGLVAISEQSHSQVIAGTVETRGQSGSAVVVMAGTDAKATVENAIAHSDGAVTVYASGGSSATVDAGSVSMLGNGAAVQAFSDQGTVAVSADAVDSHGGGIFGRGATGVSLTAGTIDAVDYGLSGRSNTGGAVELTVTDSVTVSGGTTIGVLARTTGDVTIDAASVSVTGPGAFPGTRPDGMRFDQGGIVVLGEGGSGTIAIDAGTVSVAGEHRYGISARGNGAITVSADQVTLASADSVAVVARGGEGDVSLTTRAVTTTGASGVGVFADTTTGDITIDAGTTRVENAGQAGQFTGDAIVATSDSGDISIAADDTFSAALNGSAIVGISAEDVSIVSGVAATTGTGGAAVYGSSTNGALSIVAGQITTSGNNTGAVNALSTNGTIDLDVDTIVATGTNARGIFARLGTGAATLDVGSITSTAAGITIEKNAGSSTPTTINVSGDVTSGARAINLVSRSATAAPSTYNAFINVAEGGSVSGTQGVGVNFTVNNGAAPPPFQRAGVVTIDNKGTIAGTSGTALALEQVTGIVLNHGAIAGNVNVGGGVVQNFAGATIDGSVTLTAQVGAPLSVFAYEGSNTGVTGSITGGQAVDTYAQIFRADGTAIIGGGLPTAFDRYGVLTDPTSDVTVIVETAANPVGATPSLFLLGGGSIINRADLATSVVPASGNAPAQVVPALYSYGFAPVQTPFGLRFVFEGAGTGAASFTNEADIGGRIALSTSEFVNDGTITRSSAGVPSVVTARTGHAFSFSNTGTIAMVDGGVRTRTPANGNPFNDFNPYDLPESALTIRSAVSGSLDDAGLFVPAQVSNSGVIDGGLLVRMTASTFAFANSGSIAGFNGSSTVPGLVIGLGRNWDAGAGDQNNYFAPTTLPTELATFVNSGEIADGTELHLYANTVEFSNTGTMAGGASETDALFVEQSLGEDGVDAASFTFVNTGAFDGNVGLEVEATTASVTNGGSIVGREYVPSPATFSEIMFGGEGALEIDNGTSGNGSLSFVNTGSIVNTGHAASGVVIDVEAGEDDHEPGDPDFVAVDATVSVVNSGTISATGGATVVTQQAMPWLEPGQVFVNPLGALVVDASEPTGESTITIENQAGGLIRAGGQIHVATPNDYFPIADAQEGVATVAVYAAGKTITIVNSGAIEGGAGTTPGANVVTDNPTPDNYLAGAIQTVGYEVDEADSYVASLDHVTNTATGTIVGSIDLGGNHDRLVNAGSITGDVFLRDGDDVLELHASSIIDGTVDLGAGDDVVELAGTGANVGKAATTLNAELLSVTSGSWRAEGLVSAYDSVAIGQGAILTVVENEEGSLAIETSAVRLDGVLNLDLSVDETEGDFGATPVTGSGQLHLVGTARVELTDASGLQHTGGTFVDNGELLLATEFGGDITTTGDGVFELGALGDFTGDLVNNGTFVFSRVDDYSFTGDFSGSGALQKYGAGTLAFDGLYNFVGTTEIFAGQVRFTGQLAEDTEVDLSDGVLDLSDIEGGEQTIAQLEGTGGTLELGATELTIAQDEDTVFAGDIVGSGTIQKAGDGDLKLNGDGTGFTGTGEVDGGTLSVNGDFSNASFEVNAGGTLGGSGSVGNTSVNGGTLAPGNSIDTLTVNGDVSFTAASIYEVEVNAAGQGDRINATGTATLGGARVQVIAENGSYRPLTDYTILTAAGGISGTFGSVTDNLAFLDPSLVYSANAVTLRLVRNDIDFATFGATANQAAIGGLIESFGYGNTLYNETLLLADGNVAPSFASLTGEVYPTHSAALIETVEMLRRQTADAAPQSDGVFVWATGLYNTVEGGEMDLDGHGVAGGLGYGAGGFAVSAGLGLLDQGDGGSDYLDGDLTFAVGHVGYAFMSGLSVSAAVQFGWADAVTRRQTALGTISRSVSGEIDGDYLQLSGELAYSLPVGGALQIEPFAGVSHVAVDLDPVSESGAATALAVAAIKRDVTFADVGLRVSGEVGAGVHPFASAAYRHAWGDRVSAASVGFAGTAGTALIGGVPVAGSAVELSGGLVVTRGAVNFEVGYDGTISDTFDSHGVSAGIKVRF